MFEGVRLFLCEPPKRVGSDVYFVRPNSVRAKLANLDAFEKFQRIAQRLFYAERVPLKQSIARLKFPQKPRARVSGVNLSTSVD
jgi:hypothetical protein